MNHCFLFRRRGEFGVVMRHKTVVVVSVSCSVSISGQIKTDLCSCCCLYLFKAVKLLCTLKEKKQILNFMEEQEM